MNPEMSHRNNKEWVRLCREVIEEAKKVKALGGGKVQFVAFAEKVKDEDNSV